MTSGLSSPLPALNEFIKERRSERVAPKLGVEIKDASAIVASGNFVTLHHLNLNRRRNPHVTTLALGVFLSDDDGKFQAS